MRQFHPDIVMKIVRAADCRLNIRAKEDPWQWVLQLSSVHFSLDFTSDPCQRLIKHGNTSSSRGGIDSRVDSDAP